MSKNIYKAVVLVALGANALFAADPNPFRLIVCVALLAAILGDFVEAHLL